MKVECQDEYYYYWPTILDTKRIYQLHCNVVSISGVLKPEISLDCRQNVLTFSKKILEVPPSLKFWILQMDSTALSWYQSILMEKNSHRMKMILINVHHLLIQMIVWGECKLYSKQHFLFNYYITWGLNQKERIFIIKFTEKLSWDIPWEAKLGNNLSFNFQGKKIMTLTPLSWKEIVIQGRSQGVSWVARDPPFCKPLLTKQPTTGGENAMTIPWP